MLELLKRIIKYNKSQRLHRLIEIGAKGEFASPIEQLEVMMIQAIRDQNGEIDEVIKQRESELKNSKQ